MPNPNHADKLRRARAELAQLKSEKLKLFPPNPHPFAQADAFPQNATRAQIEKRNALVGRIEELERLIKELGGD
jgi:hypothetical protein